MSEIKLDELDAKWLLSLNIKIDKAALERDAFVRYLATRYEATPAHALDLSKLAFVMKEEVRSAE